MGAGGTRTYLVEFCRTRKIGPIPFLIGPPETEQHRLIILTRIQQAVTCLSVPLVQSIPINVLKQALSGSDSGMSSVLNYEVYGVLIVSE